MAPGDLLRFWPLADGRSGPDQKRFSLKVEAQRARSHVAHGPAAQSIRSVCWLEQP